MGSSGTTYQYRDLFHQSADAMLLIDGMEFVDCNDAAVRMLGYDDREALMQVHPSKLSPPTQPDGQLSHAKAEAMIRQAIEKGSNRFEWIHRRANGEDFPVEVLLTKIQAGDSFLIHTAWRDITERKQAEERLTLSKYVIDNTSEGVVVTDTTPAIIEVNPAYCEIMGYSREEVVGKNPSFTSSGRHDKAFYEHMWRDLEQYGFWRGEVWDRRKNGEIFPKLLRINTVRDDQGQPRYHVGVFSDITQAKENERRLKALAYADPLTQLANRTLFQDHLTKEIRFAELEGKEVALLFVDLDLFKRVNDTYGHGVGDELLIQVGERIENCVARAGLVARMGGDEFTVILAETGTMPLHEAAAILAARLEEQFSIPFPLATQDIKIGASIGIALYPNDGTTVSDLMRHADMAMYQAKALPGRSYCFFSQQLNDENQRQMEIAAELLQARVGEEFIVHYQPKVDMVSGRWVGVEALVRWEHPTKGIIPPAEFIPVAEETGSIVPLGLHVLYTACQTARQWMEHTREPFRLAVNLSMRQFHDPHLASDISRILAETRFPPDCLEIEITESCMMERVEETTAVLSSLKALGIRLAVDDFGTGYSSLNYLKRLPLDTIKVDRSFVMDIDHDESDRAIVTATVLMAKGLNLEVIAEGIETKGQEDFLLALGCRFGQGYHYSKPLPAEAVEHKLRCLV